MMREIEKKNNCKIKKCNIYITYTILFCIISFSVFAIFLFNNRSFIWEGDGVKQHFVILYDFNQIIRNIFNEGIPMLSWNLGLGLDIIGQYSYYVLGDPFVYISLLFPVDMLEIAYNFLILLRIYCVGLAFIFYCKYTKKENINIILGTIIYTFCGFVLYAGIKHPYFTNAAIFLPLTLLGTEKLLKENKKTFLIFIIAISAISNYYFFYMITIVNIIYGVIKYIFQYNEGIKVFYKKSVNIILCYIVGLLIASIIFLPTIYAFLNSARTESEQVTTYISQFYEIFFMGIVTMRFKNWAVVGVSSIILLMIPVLFTKFNNKESKGFSALFLLTTVMLLIPKVASLMNGFSFPSNRWVFAYSFILSYIVTLTFNTKLEYSRKQKISMLMILIIYSFIGIWISKLNIKEYLDYYIAITLAYIIYLIIKHKYKNDRNVKFANYIIILLVIVNIFMVSLSVYSSKGNGYAKEFIKNGTLEEKCNTVDGKIENFSKAISYIKENDESFYRILKKETLYENLSIFHDYNPIQLYLSIGNGNVYNLSSSLEDNCYLSTKCINCADRRTKYTTLLANKYFICEVEQSRYVPYGYVLYHQIGNTQIYINKNYLPVGIIYNSYITREQFEKLTALEKEDSLITTAMVENNEKINIEENLNIEINTPISLNYTVLENRIKNNSINIKENNENIELMLDEIPKDYELYLSIKNLKYISDNNKTDFKITAKIDGITNSEYVSDWSSSAYYKDNPNFLINLGITQQKQSNKLKLNFNKKGTYTFEDFEILAVSMKKYEEKIDKLKTNVMKNIEYGNNYIKGTVNTQKNGILQITTSYSEGWKVYVDGKKHEIIKVNEAFIGTVIEAGEHEIEFKYETPYLKFGILLSVMGITIFIVIILMEKRKIRFS